MAQQSDLDELRAIYSEAIRRGEAQEADAAVTRGIALDVPLQKLYLNVIMPAQVMVGERRAAGQINTADEQAAAQITLLEMARLRNLIKPKQRIERSVLVTSIEGGNHPVPARLAADFFMLEGWDVLFLAADTPLKEIVQCAQNHHVDLACLSVTHAEYLPRAGAAAKSLCELAHKPKLIIDGPRALMHSPEAKNLQVDAITWDMAQLLREARAVLGLSQAETALMIFLKALGGRIRESRKNRGMNQQELAHRSGLDRAYISSLENGKQNLTLGAVSKLAEALGISIEELLVGQD